MKIKDLIPSILLHNLGKTAATKKVHFQDRWERNAHKKRFTAHQFIKQNNQNNIIFALSVGIKRRERGSMYISSVYLTTYFDPQKILSVDQIN